MVERRKKDRGLVFDVTINGSSMIITPKFHLPVEKMDEIKQVIATRSIECKVVYVGVGEHGFSLPHKGKTSDMGTADDVIGIIRSMLPSRAFA